MVMRKGFDHALRSSTSPLGSFSKLGFGKTTGDLIPGAIQSAQDIAQSATLRNSHLIFCGPISIRRDPGSLFVASRAEVVGAKHSSNCCL